MHELLVSVLDNRELCKAGQLFNVSDWDIVSDLHTSLVKLKDIFNCDDYVSDANTQSVVEICLARITSAVRETCSMETYAPGLVDLLEACLGHSFPLSTTPQLHDNAAPHAKIASDLLSCIFLHYSNRSVMTVAIPAAVKVLSTHHKDLIRSTSSYLALAAIQNARLLAHYSLPIITSIVNGNYSLLRVLPQVYAENPAPYHAHLAGLIGLLAACEPADKLCLLQLVSLVANNRPELLASHMAALSACLLQPSSCTAVLCIFLSMITNGQTAGLCHELGALKAVCRERKLSSTNLATVAKIVAAVGRLNKENGQEAICFLLVECEKADASSTPVLLKEVEHLAEYWPNLVRPYLPEIHKLAESVNSSAWLRIRDLCSEDENTRNSLRQLSSSEMITSQPTNSIADESLSRRSSPCSLRDVQAQSSSSSIQQSTERTSLIPQPRTTTSNLTKRKSRSSGNLNNVNRRYHSPSQLQTRNTPVVSAAQSPAVRRSPVDAASRTTQGGYVKNTFSNSGNRSSAALIQMKSNASAGSPYLSIPLAPLHLTACQEATVNTCSEADRQQQQQQQQCAGSPVLTAGSVASALNGNSVIVLPVTRPDGTTQQWKYTYMANGRVTLKPVHQRPSVSAAGTNSHLVTTFNAQDQHVTQTTGVAASGSVYVEPSGSGQPRTSSARRTWAMSADETAISLLTQQTNGLPSDGLYRTDAVKQFCEKHRVKIRDYMSKITAQLAVPYQCTVEEVGHSSKHRMRVHFGCDERSQQQQHCLYPANQLFCFKTRLPHLWLHLMFLQLQAQQTTAVLGQSHDQVQKLKQCWECMPSYVIKNRSFSALVTSAFPAAREQQQLIKELHSAHFYDAFSCGDPGHRWLCSPCMNPEKVSHLQQTRHNNDPVLEGRLKEKRGKWKLFRRWQTKYFTLSTAALTYRDEWQQQPTSASDGELMATIDLRSIRSVKSVNRRSGRKQLPRAFEIFTEDHKSYVLKAQDGSSADEWLKCLTIAVAQAKDSHSHTHVAYL